MIEPSNFVSGKTMLMNIAGVVAMPQSTTLTPQEERPAIAAFARASPVIRESRPIPTVKDSTDLPHFFESHEAKLWAIIFDARGVRFTFSPSIPSQATPRMSLPFCNFNNSFDCIMI